MKRILFIILIIISAKSYAQKDTLLFNNGNKKEKNHDYTGAITDWTKALKINPKYLMAYYKRAVAEQLYLQDLKAAMNDYGKVIELDPNSELSYVNRGQCEYAMHGLNFAIQDFNKAISINPNNGYAYCSRAVAKYDAGDRTSVCEDFDKAIALGYRQASIIRKDYCKSK